MKLKRGKKPRSLVGPAALEAIRFRAAAMLEQKKRAKAETRAAREDSRLLRIGDRIAATVVSYLTPKTEPNNEARWHGAHAVLQALMHAGAIKEQYVLFIREHLAMRREAVFQINGIAILPPDVPR